MGKRERERERRSCTCVRHREISALPPNCLSGEVDGAHARALSIYARDCALTCPCTGARQSAKPEERSETRARARGERAGRAGKKPAERTRAGGTAIRSQFGVHIPLHIIAIHRSRRTCRGGSGISVRYDTPRARCTLSPSLFLSSSLPLFIPRDTARTSASIRVYAIINRALHSRAFIVR